MTASARYTAAEDALLMSDETDAMLSIRLGRSTHGIRKRRTASRRAGRTIPKPRSVFNHPTDLVASLREMYAAGSTYTQIGEALDLNRSAVAGLVNRKCKDIKAARMAGRPSVSSTPKVPRDPPVSKPVLVVPAPAPVEPKPLPVMVVIQTNPTPFIEASGCRWPLWDPAARLDDKRVCGSASGRDTYCVDHTRLAYRTPERRAA